MKQLEFCKNRSRPQGCFVRKDVPKNFAKFTGMKKNKKVTLAKVFSCEF